MLMSIRVGVDPVDKHRKTHGAVGELASSSRKCRRNGLSIGKTENHVVRWIGSSELDSELEQLRSCSCIR